MGSDIPYLLTKSVNVSICIYLSIYILSNPRRYCFPIHFIFSIFIYYI